jgi:hypothetical protein
MSLRKSALTGVSAIALSLGLAYSANANPALPVYEHRVQYVNQLANAG